MIKETFRIELIVPDEEKLKVFSEKLVPRIVNTLVTLGMSTADQFSEQEEQFVRVLRDEFKLQFGKQFGLFSGKYHQAFDDMGPRYDLGLKVGEGEAGMYPIRVELIIVPEEKTTLH